MISNLRMAAAYLKERSFLLIWSVWILLFLEFFSRDDLTDTLSWSLSHWPQLLVDVALLLGLMLLFQLFLGRSAVAYWLLALISLPLAAVSGIKLKMMGIPLLPWDILRTGEAIEVVDPLSVVDRVLVWGIAVFIPGSILLVHWLFRQYARRIVLKERAILAGVGVLLLAGAAIQPMAFGGSEQGVWDQAGHVRSSGFLLAMLQNLRAGGDSPLQGDARAAFAALDQQANDLPTDPGIRQGRPNIIVVLSESFWDITKLPNVTFSRDPIPTVHSLQQKYTSGWMLSPEFAGSTANVELEVLTGLSMKLLPEGVLAYEKYIDRPVDSLASILTRQGYSATVISPWQNWFFNSRDAYRNLGFGKFISGEFLPQIKSGYYLADDVIAKEIIAESQRGSGPHFIFANTSENHYEYNPGKFPENTIRAYGLSEYATGQVETYAQGSSKADLMLQTLVEHFTQVKEPTIIVFFGDHMPLLGRDYLVYKESKYITGETDPDFLEKIYREPVVIWNNYQPAHQEAIRFGANYLGPYILDQAHLPGTPFTAFLKDLSTRVPAIPARRFWGQVKLTEADLAEYEALQHDILQGEQKTYGDYKGQIVNPDFVLGYGPLTAERAEVEWKPGAQPLLRVTGRNFPTTAVLQVSGKVLPTTWFSDTQLAAEVPSDLAQNKPWSVEVRVLDPEDHSVVLGSAALAVTP